MNDIVNAVKGVVALFQSRIPAMNTGNGGTALCGGD